MVVVRRVMGVGGRALASHVHRRRHGGRHLARHGDRHRGGIRHERQGEDEGKEGRASVRHLVEGMIPRTGPLAQPL